MPEVVSTILLIICSLLLGSLLTYSYMKYKCFCKDCKDFRAALFGKRISPLNQSLRSDPYPINHTINVEPHTMFDTRNSTFHTWNNNATDIVQSPLSHTFPTRNIQEYPTTPTDAINNAHINSNSNTDSNTNETRIHTNTLGEQVI
tara:strand:+ start:160 stop:597 length:438 start_codon:yes stop_codon:yes gene_type:complete